MFTERLSIDAYGIALAHIVSLRSTCRRRRAGCVIIDKNKHIRATGYNGVPRHGIHCLDVPCSGAESESGSNLDECGAVHAEENAIIQMNDKHFDPFTIYLTCTPCLHCAKVLCNFPGIKRIVASEEYPSKKAIHLLKEAGIGVDIIPFDKMKLIEFLTL